MREMLYRAKEESSKKWVTAKCIYEVIGNIHDNSELLGGAK